MEGSEKRKGQSADRRHVASKQGVHGVVIESVTTDGGKNIIKAVEKACPHAIRQRCLAHIQRVCNVWLTKSPKSVAGKELKRIVNLISKVKTNNDMLQWRIELADWYERHRT